MTKIFFTVAFCVIVLDIIMMLLPADSYGKYAKTACGLTAVAVILSIVFGADIDFTLSEKYMNETFSVQEAKEAAVNQTVKITENNVKAELFNKYGREFRCSIDEGFETITVFSYKDIDEKELKGYITSVCSIEGEKIIVRYN